MATVACEPMQLQKIGQDLNKAIDETKAIKLDAQPKLAAEHQKLKNTEARCATLEAYMHHETAKADRCWSRAEALEEANIALKEELELLKRERSQLHSDLNYKDELIIYAVETRKARKRSQVDLMAKLASKEDELKSTEARCAALEACLHHETAKANRCWSRAEALEEANIALKEEVELFKSERNQHQTDLKRKYEHEDSMRWSQLQEELKRKDELIIYAVETRKARKRSQVDLMAKLASKEDELKSTEARCAALEANLHQELTQAQATWSRNLEALKKDNVALKEKVHLLKSAQSQLELAITKIEERQAHSKQTNRSDSMADVTSNQELQSTEDEREVTLETPEASQELAQSEEECGSEVKLPQTKEECIIEVELLQSEGGCSSEVELPQMEDKCSSEAQLPQSEGGCSSEMQQLVILKNVKVEHETEESKHKSSNKKAKNNKQLHQKKKKRRSRRPHSFY
ncbi:paramyosin-like [Paralichthys olivaceus]|uniref:paramyosin-like n=1 Tax=Paralichthys olivaceus TaxID=8255 RepID=UPI003750688D